MDLWHLLRVVTEILALQARRWMVLFMSFALWVWVVKAPTIERIVAATLFTALCHLPIWFEREESHGRQASTRADAQRSSARTRNNGESAVES